MGSSYNYKSSYQYDYGSSQQQRDNISREQQQRTKQSSTNITAKQIHDSPNDFQIARKDDIKYSRNDILEMSKKSNQVSDFDSRPSYQKQNLQDDFKYTKDNDESHLNPRSKAKAVKGISNIGNTCFLNSALQCVINSPVFNNAFIKKDYASQLNSKNKGIAKAYSEFIISMREESSSSSYSYYSSSSGVGDARSLKNKVELVNKQFTGYQQQDSQEFLRALLDGLHEDLNRVSRKPKYEELLGDLNIKDFSNENDYYKKIQQFSNQWYEYYSQRDSSIVTDFFQGQLLSLVRCQICQNESLAFDNFQDLSISFTKGLQQLQDVSLDRLLDKFLEEETLDEYRCSKCKKTHKNKKQFHLWRLPDLFIIHLKRFKFSGGRHTGQKLNQNVNFPIKNLDLSSFVKKHVHPSTHDPIYDLYGIVHHSGSLYGGHYTAECMNPVDRRWYRFNDSQVNEININAQSYENRGSSSAYLLFYAKRSLLKKE